MTHNCPYCRYSVTRYRKPRVTNCPRCHGLLLVPGEEEGEGEEPQSQRTSLTLVLGALVVMVINWHNLL